MKKLFSIVGFIFPVFCWSQQPDNKKLDSILKVLPKTKLVESMQKNAEFNQGKLTVEQNKQLELVQKDSARQMPLLPEARKIISESMDAKIMQMQQFKSFIDKIESFRDKIEIPSATELGSIKPLLQGPTQTDSRVEIRQLSPLITNQLQMIKNAASVGMIVRKQDIEKIGDSIYTLNTTTTLQNRFKLCPGEAFKDQPTAGEATGFLISNNSFITAIHAMEGNIKDYAFVFGYELVNKAGAYVSLINEIDIYYPDSILYADLDRDILMVKLNRESTRPGLSLFSKPTLPVSTKIYMIGHPSGLPQKASVNASILTNSDPYYFLSSLDAYQGSSGSPVFEIATGKVIGMLVSGAVDYIWNGSCNVSKICSIPYCEGEKILKLPIELLDILSK
jgi:hypothetical protein